MFVCFTNVLTWGKMLFWVLARGNFTWLEEGSKEKAFREAHRGLHVCTKRGRTSMGNSRITEGTRTTKVPVLHRNRIIQMLKTRTQNLLDEQG